MTLSGKFRGELIIPERSFVMPDEERGPQLIADAHIGERHGNKWKQQDQQ